jgi:hypothetical protein
VSACAESVSESDLEIFETVSSQWESICSDVCPQTAGEGSFQRRRQAVGHLARGSIDSDLSMIEEGQRSKRSLALGREGGSSQEFGSVSSERPSGADSHISRARDVCSWEGEACCSQEVWLLFCVCSERRGGKGRTESAHLAKTSHASWLAREELQPPERD